MQLLCPVLKPSMHTEISWTSQGSVWTCFYGHMVSTSWIRARLFKETSNVAQTKSAPLCQRKYRHPLWKTWSPLTVDGYNAPSSVHISVNIWSLLAFCLRGETNQPFIFLLKTEIVSWHEGECCTWVCFLFNEVLFLANAQLKIMGIWLWFGNGCYVARLVWLLSQLSLSP